MKKSELLDKFSKQQRNILGKNIPVLVLVEGYESSGRGYLINECIKELDPRGFEVRVFEKPEAHEKRKPFLWRFFKNIPKRGQICFFDKSYYAPLLTNQRLSREEQDVLLDEIQDFEQLLLNDEMCIIKFFITTSFIEQKKTLLRIASSPATNFLSSKLDYYQNVHFEEYQTYYQDFFTYISNHHPPFYQIDGRDKKKATKDMLTIITEQIDQALQKQNKKHKKKDLPIVSAQKLEDIDLNLHLTKEDYKDQKKRLQKEAKELAYKLYTYKIPTIILFEGWDAAGKGGAIKRLTRSLDPRGYDVITIAAPSELELQYHYLWRFNENLPKEGHMSIFDRSWYGRVLVEKVEQFTPDARTDLAYEEINLFEKSLTKWGAIVLKFFIHISEDEQLRRFKAREEDPLKHYKITDEDWRNRKKNKEYKKLYNQMFRSTSTLYAPWTIVEGNDKYYARIKVLKTFIQVAKETLKKVEHNVSTSESLAHKVLVEDL